MLELKKGTLVGLALDRIRELNELASDYLTKESISDKKGDIVSAGNPLSGASSAISNAQRWITALIRELN